MNPVLAAALCKLEDAGGTLAASAFTLAQRRTLDEFARTSGGIQCQPAGRGSLYRVRSSGVFREALLLARPLAQHEIDRSWPTRAGNIGRHRDSKAGVQRHTRHYLLMKAIGSGVLWTSGEHVLDLSASTHATGAGVIATDRGDAWRSSSPLWLVENQALFDRVDWVPDQVPASIAYYAGQLSSEFIDWIASRPRASSIVHFPDYDGVGLRNHAKLRSALDGQCQFWLMPNWRAKLRRYGNAPLWQRTRSDFEVAAASLGSMSADPEFADLLCDMFNQGLALEQESIWLPAS